MMAKHMIDGFDRRLRDTILGSGKSLTRIAKDMDIDRRLIMRWTNAGTYPTIGLLMELCKYFSVSADWLLGLSDRRERR